MINIQFHRTYCSIHKAPIVIPEHTHSYHELVYFVSGEGFTNLQKNRYPYHSNQFAFYKMGTVHDEINLFPCETQATTFLCDIPKCTLEEGVFRDDRRELFPLIRRLRSLSVTSSPYQAILIEACMADILVTAARLQEQQEAPQSASRSSIDWNQVIDIIDTHYHEPIDFSRIARQFHYSYSRFRHLFSEHFGVSPQEYLVTRRLEQAKMLLAQTELSITEIAYRTGFSTSSNFTKSFRKHYGIPPKEYSQ